MVITTAGTHPLAAVGTAWQVQTFASWAPVLALVYFGIEAEVQ